jgi:hypothetical protein
MSCFCGVGCFTTLSVARSYSVELNDELERIWKETIVV